MYGPLGPCRRAPWQVLFVGPTGTGKTAYIRQVGSHFIVVGFGGAVRVGLRGAQPDPNPQVTSRTSGRMASDQMHKAQTDSVSRASRARRAVQGLDALAAQGGYHVISTAFSAQTTAAQARGGRGFWGARPAGLPHS